MSDEQKRANRLILWCAASVLVAVAFARVADVQWVAGYVVCSQADAAWKEARK